MSEQWTKGPWTVNSSARLVWVESEAEHDCGICDLYHRSAEKLHPKHNAKANARLISAAPDMAEALDAAQKTLAVITDPDRINNSSPQQAWAMAVASEQKVRAALAKARGQS